MRDASAGKAIVEMRTVRVTAEFPYDSALSVDEFVLKAGELAVVELSNEIRRAPLADVVSGLLEIENGTVFFQGVDWRVMTPDAAAHARGGIGRVFDGIASNWVSNLDNDENLTLSFRYHQGELNAETRKQIEELATIAGCWPIPEGRPASVSKNILRRLEWVRAFLGEPSLVILGRPMRDITGDAEGPLGQLVTRAREHGAAILLMVSEGESWQITAPNPSSRWRLSDGRLVEMEKN